MSKRNAKNEIVGLLTRAGAWLCTTSIKERTGLSAHNLHERLQQLEKAGMVDKRTSPENERMVEWRVSDAE